MDIKNKIIEDLKARLEEEIAVKKGEAMINAELKILIEKLEMQIELLNKINERAYKDIAELRFRIKKLSTTIDEA
jgi:chromosome segregation ATPase